jgi:predicted transcriptional regulator
MALSVRGFDRDPSRVTTMPRVSAMRPVPPLVVADLMSLEPIVVDESEPIASVDAVLRDYGISGVPVINRHGAIVGVYSLTDALRLKDVNPDALRRYSVGDVMTRPAITVDREVGLRDAARLMMDHRVHRLVAVDDAGRPVGVLSAMDFVELAAENA